MRLRVWIVLGVALGSLGIAIRCDRARQPAAERSPVPQPSAQVRPSLEITALDVTALGGARVLSTSKASDPLAAVRVQTTDGEYDLVLVREVRSLEIVDRDAASAHLGNTLALRKYEEARGKHLLMAMNGGMFHPSREPVGLLVSAGVERATLTLSSGLGNFFLLPNGVFSATTRQFRVTESTLFAAAQAGAASEPLRFATQSGPLLLQGGVEHPGFSRESPHRLIRNGVGVNGQGQSLFVISNTPVSFHELAHVFAALGFLDALYLDGTVSILYLPELGRTDSGTNLGPLIAVTD